MAVLQGQEGEGKIKRMIKHTHPHLSAKNVQKEKRNMTIKRKKGRQQTQLKDEDNDSVKEQTQDPKRH